MVKNELRRLWRQRELEKGELISIREVAEATKLNWETVANLKEGKTARFDADVLAKVCSYFGVPEGEPVPFLVYRLEEAA